MIRTINRTLQKLFLSFESALNQTIKEKNNFFYYLGTISIAMLMVLLITGLYMFIFYGPSLQGAYQSVSDLTENSIISRTIRGVHRYAADFMIVFAILHLIRIFIKGKYQNHRILAWVTGIFLLTFILIQGVSGYILPLNSTSRFVMESTSELISVVKIFGDDLTRSFSNHNLAGNWIMWVILVIHLVIPLALLLLLYLHLKKVSRPKLLLSRNLTIAFVTILLCFAIIFPVENISQADPNKIPFLEEIDYFYLFLIPSLAGGAKISIWLGFLGILAFLMAIPWFKKAEKIIAAEVEVEKCTGCKVCSIDCPYQAITMIPREDSSKYKWQPDINTNLCSGCSTCVGSCDFGGMRLVDYSNQKFRDELIQPSKNNLWHIFLCQSQFNNMNRESQDTLEKKYNLHVHPCIGIIGPQAIRYLQQAGSKGVILGSCPEGDCEFREGNQWTTERLQSKRNPKFKEITGDIRIYLLRFTSFDYKTFTREVNKIVKQDLPLDSAKIYFLKTKHTIRNWFSTGLISSTILILIFFGSTAYSKKFLPASDSSRLQIDFYMLTKEEHCDLSRISVEDLEAARQRMYGSLKMEQFTPEARKRILRMAKEGVKEKYCTRNRVPLSLVVKVGSEQIFQKIFTPRGIIEDGLIHASAKINLPAGEKTIIIEALQSGDQKRNVSIVTPLNIAFKSGFVYHIDFNKENSQFYVRK